MAARMLARVSPTLLDQHSPSGRATAGQQSTGLHRFFRLELFAEVPSQPSHRPTALAAICANHSESHLQSCSVNSSQIH